MGIQLKLFGFEPILNVINTEPVSVLAYEYFLLITPSSKIRQQVRDLKAKLNERIGISKENLNSVPHISLALFREKANRDNYIIEKVKAAAAAFNDFDIVINGARTFDHTYTRDLVLNVESREIQKLQKSLLNIFNLKAPEKFIPHITIARGITKNKFGQIEKDFHAFDLREGFICSSITLLKREIVISGKQSKSSVYTKIYEAPLDNGIRQKSA
jgi:2'-5' RNA ligase